MFGLCSCCKSCIIYYDEFVRPDKIQLDAPWMNEGPEFKVEQYYAVPNLPESEAILEVPHPDDKQVMVVKMQTFDEPIEQNVVYRLILNAVIDDPLPPSTQKTCENYYYAEFVRNGTNSSIIRLGARGAGHDSILKEETIVGLTGTQREFTAVIGENEFCASVTNSVLSFVGITINESIIYQEGRYSGMQVRMKDDDNDLVGYDMNAPTTPKVRIKSFTFSDHFDNNKICGSCLCRCDALHEIPPTIYARIWPDPDDCKRLDLLAPCEFELHWDRFSARWEGEGMCCQNYYYNSGQNWKLIFTCPTRNYYGQFDPMLAPASLLEGCLNSCGKPPGTCGELGYPISASCSPMEFTYGPVFVGGLDLTCLCSSYTSVSDLFTRGGCNYYVTVYWNP